MANPHWDEEITEDIGFKGPHFNENINVMDLYPQYTGHETWSPQGEFGQHGEFTGWKGQEDPPSYRSDWQEYPADEFTGIKTISRGRNKPQFTGLGRLGRPELSFRYSHMNPDLKNINDVSGNINQSIRGTWRNTQDARRADEMDKYGYLEGAPRQRTTFSEGYIPPWAFNEMYGGLYDDAIFRTVDPNTGSMEYADNDMMDEIMMAELSGKQENWMESGLGNPNFYSNFEDYYNSVTGQGDWKQKLGWKDEATEQEVIDKLNQMMEEKDQRLPWPVV